MSKRGGVAVVTRVMSAHRGLLVASTGAALGWQLVALAVPLVLGWVVAVGLEQSRTAAVWTGAFAVLGLAVAEAVFDGWRHHSENHAAALSSALLRVDLVDALHAGHSSVTDPGDVVARATNDVDEVSGLVDSIGYTLAYAAAIPVVTVALIIVDPLLGATALGAALLCLLVVCFSSTVWERRSEELQESVATSVGQVQEILAGIEALHGLGAADEAKARYAATSREIGARSRALARLWLWYEPGLRFTTAIAVAGVLWVGGQQVQSGELSLGELVAAVGLSIYLLTPVSAVGEQLLMARAALASAHRIAEGLSGGRGDSPVSAPDQALRVHHPDGTLAVEAGPGDVVRLVGPGATTLGRILAGQLHGPGWSASGLGLPALRLDPSAFLFSGTLEANLRLARPDASHEEITAAVVAADVQEFVVRRSAGLASDLGDRGGHLSGGQRQRVVLARALLARPAVLVVDHALSGLEPSRQERLLRNLVLESDRVVFLISDHPVAAEVSTRTLEVSP